LSDDDDDMLDANPNADAEKNCTSQA
jgi:hypothetical protein